MNMLDKNTFKVLTLVIESTENSSHVTFLGNKLYLKCKEGDKK